MSSSVVQICFQCRVTLRDVPTHLLAPIVIKLVRAFHVFYSQFYRISRDFLWLICYLKSLFHFDFRLAFNTSGDFSLFNLLFTVASNQSNFQLKIPVKVTAVALSVMRVGEMSCPEIHTFYPALCPEPHNIQQCSCVASRLSGSHHDGQSCQYAGDKTRQQEMAWLVTAEKIKSGQQKPVLNWTWTHQARQCIATARKIFLSYFFAWTFFACSYG